jgi:hypothetical protein
VSRTSIGNALIAACALLCAAWLAVPVAGAQAAEALGSVSTEDALVHNPGDRVVQVAGGRAKVAANATVTAFDGRTAAVDLNSGGEVLVCRTSELNLAEATSAGSGGARNLMLALNRGAIEIHRKAAAGDVLMTPDLRLMAETAGDFDLRVRVVFNGDTCVENRGRRSPVIDAVSAFGDASYQLKPGQHVLFEQGSLRAVIDRETTPCGCPPEDKSGMSLADAALAGRPGIGGSGSGAGANPFPAAQSEGLSGPPSADPDKAGESHVQITTQLNYSPEDALQSGSAPPPSSAPPPGQLPPPPAPQKARGRNPFKAIGRFFERIFVR